MLALAATFIGFSAFKASEQEQTGWYSITPDNDEPNEQSSQEIDNFVDTTPPSGDECSVENEQDPCQVHLDLTNFSSTTPINQLTVKQAADSGAVVGQYAKRLE